MNVSQKDVGTAEEPLVAHSLTLPVAKRKIGADNDDEDMLDNLWGLSGIEEDVNAAQPGAKSATLGKRSGKLGGGRS